ncbi:hypothetical protein [Candidatus Bartonella washoeensis]|nr:hypothetical protein [Bartonella washoeensis]
MSQSGEGGEAVKTISRVEIMPVVLREVKFEGDGKSQGSEA